MRAAALAAAALALVAAGCGETQIDTERAEEEIGQAIQQQTGIAVGEVACPDDVEAEEGGRFQCTARGQQGGEAQVQVVQTDDEGNIRFTAPDLTALGGGSGTVPEPDITEPDPEPDSGSYGSDAGE